MYIYIYIHIYTYIHVVGGSNNHFNKLHSKSSLEQNMFNKKKIHENNENEFTCFKHTRHLDAYSHLELLKRRLLK